MAYVSRLRAWLLFSSMICLACSSSSQPDSTVNVNVTASANIGAVTQLRGTLSGAGFSLVESLPKTNSASLIQFGAGTTLTFTVPRSHSGHVSVTVEALDVSSQVLGRGVGEVDIRLGGRVDVTVVLAPLGTDDAGVGDAGADAALDAPTDRASDAVPSGDVIHADGPMTGAGGIGGAIETGGAGGAGGTIATGGVAGTGGSGKIDGGSLATGGAISTGGIRGIDGGPISFGGILATGGTGSGGTTTTSLCGDGKLDPGESCDCGTNAAKLPSGCAAINGVFFGDGKGCSRSCTKEPTCRDASGKNQACTTACGDGNIDPGEACDDGNILDGDGCSSKCTVEDGFTCSPSVAEDSEPCFANAGSDCLGLSVVYRDFQPENVVGGHPDFYFLGTKANGSSTPTTICVPNAAGPARGNDSTARCWGIAAPELLNGKPQFNAGRANNTCACQFSDWSIGNTSHISGGYTQSDSPLSAGFVAAGTALNTTTPSGSVTGTITGYTASSPGGPIWKGTVPIVKDAASFNQWFTDDSTVNKTFTGILEMAHLSSSLFQFASKTHLLGRDAGFFPLDALNPSQATLCNLWPYWNRSSGSPIWPSCQGDQYLFPPMVTQSDCPNQNPLSNGCWLSNTTGTRHDSYFTTEIRYYFVYDRSWGLSIQFYGDDDLFIFINGKLVLDLGGIHMAIPGRVTVSGNPGVANIVEGGCLDSAGNITGTTAGSKACSPANSVPPVASTPDDFRNRTVDLGLTDGQVYELAIFGADRHPPESNFQLTLSGPTKKQSRCYAK